MSGRAQQIAERDAQAAALQKSIVAEKEAAAGVIARKQRHCHDVTASQGGIRAGDPWIARRHDPEKYKTD